MLSSRITFLVQRSELVVIMCCVFMVLTVYVSTTVFITQGNYIGYMFRLLNSHLQAFPLQVKSQEAVHTLGFPVCLHQ